MCHPLAPPDVPVQPETTIHSVDHPVSAPMELQVRGWRSSAFVGRFATRCGFAHSPTWMQSLLAPDRPGVHCRRERRGAANEHRATDGR
jgi:hypothetical protein